MAKTNMEMRYTRACKRGHQSVVPNENMGYPDYPNKVDGI